MPVVPVLDSTMHHEAHGSAPFVFLHGNPASSHIWRNILPELGGLAPDLIGMGRSGKPAIDYSFDDHSRYLDAWFDALALDRVVLVGHDWGGALAFDWAARHPSRVAGVAFFETMLKPLRSSELQPAALERTRRLRSPAGEELVLDQDVVVRQAFTGGVRTPVPDADMAAYLAPFPDRESRRPVLAWVRQLPVDGDPPALIPRMEAYGSWLRTSSDVPKLLLTFENSPTLAITPELARWCTENVAALEVVAAGEAGHHAQEDRPKEIAAAIGGWAESNGLVA